MGRAPCCDKIGLKKGPWSPEEDQILIDFICINGHGNWRALPKKAGLLRCGKSCRLRWINYLRPDIKRGNFSSEEEETIIKLHQLLGNRWSAIASRLPGRTDNEIKNLWNTHLKKQLSLDYSECGDKIPSMEKGNLGLIQEKASVESTSRISNSSDTSYDSYNLSSGILPSINRLESEVIINGSSSSSLDWLESSFINSFDEPLGYNQHEPPDIEDDTFIIEKQDYGAEISTYEVMLEHSSNGKAHYFTSDCAEDDFLSSMDGADTILYLPEYVELQTNNDDSDGFGYWLNVLKQTGPSPTLL
ncbi:hypothetical protein SUGI_0937960 [Cryptomeria japonica]|uniref:transcription factor MYB14-like n=1 Tax=Cryptomeria japonica TaxID=3369 RepID=UPI00241483A4|nr:transcription factor MYB14-like [Cryptomeria japonica]GLJ44626.1 hypothetical protein SUGI_0937960 [Cryptomeria japonica]